MSILTDIWLEEENKLRKDNEELRKVLLELLNTSSSDAWWLRSNYTEARKKARQILKKTKEN